MPLNFTDTPTANLYQWFQLRVALNDVEWIVDVEEWEQAHDLYMAM